MKEPRPRPEPTRVRRPRIPDLRARVASLRDETDVRLVRRRSSRALLATLAVGALAVTGLDDPSTLPAPVRAGLRPTPTPAFSMPVARPNVLMVTVDDLAVADLPYLPRLRRLMQSGGVTFADALAPTPICVPARASLLTGQYAHNHGALNISGASGGHPAFTGRDTVATALQDAGYDTLFTGKYLNGYGRNGTERDVPPGWSDWRATVDPTTYRFFGARLNVNGEVVRAKGYSTDVITRQARRMLGGERGDKPWFAWVNYVAPHVGAPAGEGDPKKVYAGTRAGRFKTTVPAPRDRGRYEKVPLPLFPSSFPAGDPTVPRRAPANTRRYDAQDKKALTTVYQRRIEAARGLDRAVDALFTTLREKRQLDKTLVIFTSDNGYAIGPHNLNGKLMQYDETVRIPVLMRGPGLPRGVSVPTAVTNPDIAATILAATGVRPPRPLDGVDILPWIGAPAQVRVVPIEAWEVRRRKQIYQGVRVGAWTYAAYRAGGEELYDRSRDPYEIHNLADDPAYADVRRGLASLTERYRDCAGTTCPREMYPAAELAELVGAGDG